MISKEESCAFRIPMAKNGRHGGRVRAAGKLVHSISWCGGSKERNA